MESNGKSREKEGRKKVKKSENLEAKKISRVVTEMCMTTLEVMKICQKYNGTALITGEVLQRQKQLCQV